LFTWLLILPVFLSSKNLTVPACCRKDGKHHCMMHPAQVYDSGPSVSSITTKCPCCPHFTLASGMHSFAASTAEAVYSGLIRHPAVTPQTEANYRVSYDRSRQKRGPPSLILS
jgi:hypothetical protein